MYQIKLSNWQPYTFATQNKSIVTGKVVTKGCGVCGYQTGCIEMENILLSR